MAKTAAPRKLAALLAGLGLQCRAVTPAPGSDVLLGSYLAFFGALGGWRGCVYIYTYIPTYLHTYIRTYIRMWIIGKWVGTLHLPQSYSWKVLRKSWMSLSRLHQVLRNPQLHLVRWLDALAHHQLLRTKSREAPEPLEIFGGLWCCTSDGETAWGDPPAAEFPGISGHNGGIHDKRNLRVPRGCQRNHAISVIYQQFRLL